MAFNDERNFLTPEEVLELNFAKLETERDYISSEFVGTEMEDIFNNVEINTENYFLNSNKENSIDVTSPFVTGTLESINRYEWEIVHGMDGLEVDSISSPDLDAFAFRDNGPNSEENCASYFQILKSIRKKYYSRFAKDIFNKNPKFTSGQFCLLNHFAQCEIDARRNGTEVSYTDPEYPGRVLLKKKRLCITPNKAELVYVTFFHVNGGTNIINRIMDLNPLFFLILSYFHCHPSLLNEVGSALSIRRMDLCVRTTQQLMPYLAHSLRRGHVQSNGSHLYAFGSLDNVDFEGPVGRQSLLYDKIKDNNSFNLYTLYSGHRTRPFKIRIYDKRRERLVKESSFSKIQTHIELEIQPHRLQAPEILQEVLRTKGFGSSKLENSIVEKTAGAQGICDWNFFQNFFGSYFSKGGYRFRTSFMLDQLNKNFIITTIQRPNKNAKDFYLSDQVSDWWRTSFVYPQLKLIQRFTATAITNIQSLFQKNPHLTNNQLGQAHYHPFHCLLYDELKKGIKATKLLINWGRFPILQSAGNFQKYIFYLTKECQYFLDCLKQTKQINALQEHLNYLNKLKDEVENDLTLFQYD